MKGKKRTNIYGLRTAAAIALCACVLCGCSKTGGSDIGTQTQATAPPQQTSVQSEKAADTTTASEEESSQQDSKKSKKPAKTTTKASQTKKESESTSLSKQSGTQSGTGSTQQTTSPASTTAAVTEKPDSEPANATVTSKITTAGGMETGSSKPAEKTPDYPETQYHIYADGYVTKYDELKLKNLTKEQRGAYDALSEGIWKMQTDIKISGKVIKQDEAADFLYTVLGTMPEVNYVSGTFKVTVIGGYVSKYTIDYTLSADKAGGQHRALRAAASKIIGSLSPNMTDAEKVRAFHDYIVKHCTYSKQGGKSSYTAYGCLVEGKAVCEGYAMAMDYLCEKAGIYSLLISGESTGSSGQTLTHIWNKILLDGRWYNFDVTWDDPVSNFGADYVRYDYFAVTDKDIENTHKVDKNRFGYYPEADAGEENYFKKNGLYIESADQADEIMTKAFAVSLEEGQICTSVRCSGSDVYSEVYKLLMSSNEQTGQHRISACLKAACERTGIDREYCGFYMVKNEKLGIIAVILK